MEARGQKLEVRGWMASKTRLWYPPFFLWVWWLGQRCWRIHLGLNRELFYGNLEITFSWQGFFLFVLQQIHHHFYLDALHHFFITSVTKVKKKFCLSLKRLSCFDITRFKLFSLLYFIDLVICSILLLNSLKVCIQVKN